MRLLSPQVVGSCMLVTELALLLTKRSGARSAATDRGSLGRLWLVISVAIATAFVVAGAVTAAASGLLGSLRPAGGALFLAGLLLRGWSILHLGRSFTVDVTVAEGQRVIDTGPYRFIRHPSYTGALLEMLGLAITFGNWLSLLVLVVPVGWVFLQRIRIEEQALSSGLGEPYRRYMARTRRLVPGLY